jgi:hypothetical protein
MNVNATPQLTAGGDAHAGGKMTLAGAGFTNQQGRFSAFEIAVLGQGAEAAAGARTLSKRRSRSFGNWMLQ